MPNNKCGMTMMWYKNFIKNLIFDLYMRFIVFFRLKFCKAVSKEGCSVVAFKKVTWQNEMFFFMQPG